MWQSVWVRVNVCVTVWAEKCLLAIYKENQGSNLARMTHLLFPLSAMQNPWSWCRMAVVSMCIYFFVCRHALARQHLFFPQGPGQKWSPYPKLNPSPKPSQIFRETENTNKTTAFHPLSKVFTQSRSEVQNRASEQRTGPEARTRRTRSYLNSHKNRFRQRQVKTGQGPKPSESIRVR